MEVALARYACPGAYTRRSQTTERALVADLLAAGGETLRGICEALGATSLEVRGHFEPGLPHSVMRGGAWDGATVVSKSGAFGGPTLWRDLLSAHGHAVGHGQHEPGRNAEKVEA